MTGEDTRATRHENSKNILSVASILRDYTTSMFLFSFGTSGGKKLYSSTQNLLCPSPEDGGGPGRSCWDLRARLGLGRWTEWLLFWKDVICSGQVSLTLGSHKASSNFCVLLKRIQSVFQIWIECVCLKNYFLCKSCSKCEMICLSNCPSKETQA